MLTSYSCYKHLTANCVYVCVHLCVPSTLPRHPIPYSHTDDTHWIQMSFEFPTNSL